MLNCVFSRGSEPDSGIDYGMSSHDHTGTRRSVDPRVLFGDPEPVKAVVRTLSCKQRYSAGVLSFAERDLPEKLKQSILREHLRMSFPGMDPARIAAVYIQHQDKGFLEIHYWIAHADLATGKKLTPYWWKSIGSDTIE